MCIRISVPFLRGYKSQWNSKIEHAIQKKVKEYSFKRNDYSKNTSEKQPLIKKDWNLKHFRGAYGIVPRPLHMLTEKNFYRIVWLLTVLLGGKGMK